jgi:hypothetical protein
VSSCSNIHVSVLMGRSRNQKRNLFRNDTTPNKARIHIWNVRCANSP